MEIILKRDYKNLGSKGEIVVVKPGYARNFLIPRNIASLADEGVKKVIMENSRQAALKSLKLKEEAQALVARLEGMSVLIRVKIGEEGKVFGSVTALQISKALKEQGIAVDHTAISLDVPIKQVGAYKAQLTLHPEVVYTLNFTVSSL